MKDCAGTCNGSAMIDCTGTCCGGDSERPTCLYNDCFDVCGGSAAPDCNGVCGGDYFRDCAGVCMAPCGGGPTCDCCELCTPQQKMHLKPGEHLIGTGKALPSRNPVAIKGNKPATIKKQDPKNKKQDPKNKKQDSKKPIKREEKKNKKVGYVDRKKTQKKEVVKTEANVEKKEEVNDEKTVKKDDIKVEDKKEEDKKEVNKKEIQGSLRPTSTSVSSSLKIMPKINGPVPKGFVLPKSRSASLRTPYNARKTIEDLMEEPDDINSGVVQSFKLGSSFRE